MRHVNDLPGNLEYLARLFADNTAIYLRRNEDLSMLQSNQEWEVK